MNFSNQKSLVFIKVDVSGVSSSLIHALIERYTAMFRKDNLQDQYQIYIIPVHTGTGNVDIDYLPANVIVSTEDAKKAVKSITTELADILTEFKKDVKELD